MSEAVERSSRRGLGRGLGSLLAKEVEGPSSGETFAVSGAELDPSKVIMVPIEKLRPMKDQPRVSFDSEKLRELSLSIKEKGILQPILAQKEPEGGFKIIAGERRWRAAQLAGLKEVPVLVKRVSHPESLEIALIENIQRQDLNPIEEAEAYHRLLEIESLSHQELADKVGKDRATISNSLRLLSLSDQVIEMVRHSELSMGHAKVLLSVRDEVQQLDLAEKTVREKWSVRNLETQVRKMGRESPPDGSGHNTEAFLSMQAMTEALQTKVGLRASVRWNSKLEKGQLALQFTSYEEFEDLIQRLKVDHEEKCS